MSVVFCDYFRGVLVSLIFASLSFGFAFSVSAQSFNERRERLKQAERVLAEKVLHQDRANQALIQSIRPWYLNPEGRRYPKVVGLWGPTGTGKTSSIDVVIEALALKPTTVRLDMQSFADKTEAGGFDSISDDDRPIRSIAERLIKPFLSYEPFELKYDDPDFEVHLDLSDWRGLPKVKLPKDMVIILDEFQYARTLDPKSNPIDNSKLQAIWEILGNQGKISVPNPAYGFFEEVLKSFERNLFIHTKVDLDSLNLDSDEKKKEKERREKRIQAIKKELRAKVKKLRQAESAEIVVDFSSAIFFPMGNLDRLFTGSMVYDPEFANADEIHASAQRITPDDLRRELGRYFTPKDLSRLGSPHQHILYLPFSRAGFKQHIQNLVEVEKQNAAHLRLNLDITAELYERIYDEVVVASQGVRPLQGSIPQFFGDAAASIRAHLTEVGAPRSRTVTVKVSIHPDDPTQALWTIVTARGKSESFSFPIPSESVREKKPYSEPLGAIAAFYYASQAAVYMAVRKEYPRAVHSRSRSARSGFLNTRQFSDEEYEALGAHQWLSEIVWRLGGLVAEELLYEKPSSVAQGDLADATSIAASMAGRNGFVDMLVSADVLRRDLNDPSEGVLRTAKKKANEIITREVEFIRALTQLLQTQTKVDEIQLKELAMQYWSQKEEALQIQTSQHFQDRNRTAGNACSNAVAEFVRSQRKLKLPESRIGFRP